MMHPNHLPGRNRDFDATPHQAWGRSGQGYGRTGHVEYEPWDPPYGKYGQNHPLVTHGPIVLGILAVVMIGAAVLSAMGVW